MKDVYERLALNDEQKAILKEFKECYHKMLNADIGLVETYYGMFAYNSKEVNCFNAPLNAAYNNEKHKIRIPMLSLALNFGLANKEFLGADKECLVVFDED